MMACVGLGVHWFVYVVVVFFKLMGSKLIVFTYSMGSFKTNTRFEPKLLEPIGRTLGLCVG